MAAAVALAGCKGDPKAAAPCPPPGFLPQVTKAAAGSPISVYLDGSLSMAGYIDAQTRDLRPHGDILALIPSSSARYFSFGKAIHAIPSQDSDAYATSAPYRCKGADCDNLESRIDLVLGRIQSAPKDSLSVIVTDLWLSSGSVLGSPQVALGDPLAQMLASGRAVGIVGVRAPYRGPIYDLPSGGAYQGATERPLFVILIGPEAKVTAFKERLVQGGSPSFAGDRLRYSLFSSSPVAAVRVGSSVPLRTEGAGAVAGAALHPGLMKDVRQYRLSLSKGGAVSASVDAGTAVPQGAVWAGPLKAGTRVWLLKSERALQSCSADTWAKYSPLRGAWRAAGPKAAKAATFRLDAKSAEVLTPGRVYFIAADLGSRELTTPNEASAWMRQWSFDASGERALVGSRPTFFKALNLSDLAGIMEASLKRATPTGQTTVTVPLIVKVER